MTELSERNSSDPINIHEYHRLRDELNDLVHSVSFWKNQCERMEITISELRHECEILREKNIETFRGRLEAEWNRLQQEKEEYSRSVRLLRVEKENLANNVDARLRELMEAYRTEIDGDLERYRTEAENAKEALSALREEIQREDLSAGLIAQLALSDTRISDMEGKGKDPYPTHFLLTCPEVNHALAAMARDLVDSIPRSMKEDPNVVEVYYLHRIKVGLSDVLKCFSQYLQLEKHRFGEQLNECEHEKQKLIQQNHVLSLLHDRELKGMMAKHETDLKMWKCDMTAMNSALHISINKDQDSLQSLSTNYYRNQLHLTHRKLEELNSRFEIEKERMIQMCIIMKGTLVRQQEEFEHAILKKADELVACQTNIISRLRVRLHELECERKKHTCSSCNVSVNVSDEIKQSAEHLNSTMGNISSKYVSNTAESVNSMWGLRRFHLNDAVMMKTQELFRKYKNYVPSNLNLQENF